MTRVGDLLRGLFRDGYGIARSHGERRSFTDAHESLTSLYDVPLGH